MRRTLFQRLLCITAFALLLSAVTLAESAHMVVAGDGAVMKLHSGVYGDLFSGGYQAGLESSVLALDIVGLGKQERLLVPASEDVFAETPSALFYEKNYDVAFLLWEGLLNGVHPLLYLTSYDGSNWSEVIQITGGIFTDKGDTHLAIVPESGPNAKSSASFNTPHSRTSVYVVWEEKSGTGSQKYLAPIILKDGSYPGWHSSFRLSDFLGEADDRQTPLQTASHLEHLLTIQSSATDGAVSIAFVNPDTGRLVTLGVGLLPRALSDLAAHLEDLIAEYGETASDMDELIAYVRAAMLEDGAEFHLGMLEHLMDRVESVLREQPSVSAAVAPEIRDKAGMQFIEIGARSKSTGLIDPAPLLKIIEFGPTPDGGAPFDHVKVSLLADREMPAVGSEPRLFLSATGHEALVAWPESDAILYRETVGEAWSEVQMVEIQAGLDQETIYKILAARVYNR